MIYVDSHKIHPDWWKLLLAPSLQKDDSAKQEMWRVENKFLISTYSYNAGPPRL